MCISLSRTNVYSFFRYSVLLSELPGINRRTLSRLVGHLRAVARQSERNRMPNYNLAAIWGPTLLTVDGQVGGAK